MVIDWAQILSFKSIGSCTITPILIIFLYSEEDIPMRLKISRTPETQIQLMEDVESEEEIGKKHALKNMTSSL